jgi:hypothetical protein
VTKVIRGSRRHVLDWCSRPSFKNELLSLALPVRCEEAPFSRWMPLSYAEPQEARLETFLSTALPMFTKRNEFCSWWLTHPTGANTPNWDIAASCLVGGTPGLILVEAKANVPELSGAPKAAPRKDSPNSVTNHDRIGAAIEDANSSLRRAHPSIAISRDKSYQLSNRIAFAWRLASWGVPVVLIYLGFLADEGIRDAGEPLKDASTWEDLVAHHLEAVGASSLAGGPNDCGAAPFWLLVRSRQVLSQSPPRGPH